MNSRFIRWQLWFIGGLVLILLLEWWYFVTNRNELQALLNKSIQSEYQADELPELDLPEHTAESFSAIVERPLFIEGRKPLPEKAPDAPVAAETGQLDEWLLIGIYTDKNKRQFALFRKQNEAKKFLKLTKDQMISGWQLKIIQGDRVVLEQGGQEKPLMLLKPRPQGKTPTTPVKPAAKPAGQPQRPGQPPHAANPVNQANPANPVVPAAPVEPSTNPSPENDIDES